jgi:hypothetical protein
MLRQLVLVAYCLQLTSKKPDGILKATDFGLSRFFKEGQVLDEIVGSPFYVAPGGWWEESISA